MRKQILQNKKTYSEMLDGCSTWQEVVAMKNPDLDRSSYVVLADPSWIESFSNEDSLWAEQEEIDDDEEMQSDYDLLLNEIKSILDPDELKVYLLSAEDAGSLRWIASKVGRSHEWTRSKLASAKEKLKTSLKAKWRY